MSRRVWNDARFQSLSAPQPNAQTLWFRLLTGPELTVIPGVIPTGAAGLAETMDWPLEGFREAFREVFREGLAEADWKARLVWVPKALKHNEPENPNVVRSWASTWAELPECGLKTTIWSALHDYAKSKGPQWLAAFSEACPKPFSKPLAKPFDNPSAKPLANQEQEQEQEQEQKQEQEQEQEQENHLAMQRVEKVKDTRPPSRTTRSARKALELPLPLRDVPVPPEVMRTNPFPEADTLGKLWALRLKALPPKEWPKSEAAERAQHAQLATAVEIHGAAAAASGILQAIGSGWRGFSAKWVAPDHSRGNGRGQPPPIHYPMGAAPDSATAIKAKALADQARREGQLRIDEFERRKAEEANRATGA